MAPPSGGFAMNEPVGTRTDVALGVLVEVAGFLSQGIGYDDSLGRVADLLCQRGVVSELRIWVRSRPGDELLPALGEGPAVPATEVPAWMAGGVPPGSDRAVIRLPIATDDRPLGLLEAEVAEARADEARQILTVVAGAMALWLASSELSQDLASEVAYRTREIDAHRRFTAQIIDSLPVGLYVVDRDYLIQAWNLKRETGTQGISREQALGRPVFDILSRQPRELLKLEFDRVFDTGRIEQIDVESTASGETRQFRISKIPMRLNAEEVTHVITIGEDVTEWKTIQEQISQTDKLAAVGQLAAGVMHELNNPLATIGACVEALTVRMPDLPPADQQVLDEYLRIIDSELERCKAIVDGLLDFSHPRAHAKQAENINQVLEDALFLVKHHDSFRNIELVRRLNRGLPDIWGNAKQLIQVFLAMMLNAFDAMEGRGTLTVETKLNPERGDEVMVLFSDTGLGISRENLSKIFEPFFTTKVTGRGTGLGLSICYAVVQEHRGRIVVDSQLGSGTTFRVFLPVAGPDGAPART